MKFATQMFNISHHTLPMLLHYPGKFKSLNLLQIRMASCNTVRLGLDLTIEQPLQDVGCHSAASLSFNVNELKLRS